MTNEEWIERYKAHFMKVADLTEADAKACVEACPIEEHRAMFEDDPEGAVEEEMSYWDNDEA